MKSTLKFACLMLIGVCIGACIGCPSEDPAAVDTDVPPTVGTVDQAQVEPSVTVPEGIQPHDPGPGLSMDPEDAPDAAVEEKTETPEGVDDPNLNPFLPAVAPAAEN